MIGVRVGWQWDYTDTDLFIEPLTLPERGTGSDLSFDECV